jgi:hypothetical protein
VLAHYGVVALPCRVRHPDRKGKVESGIGHTQRTALKGLRGSKELSSPDAVALLHKAAGGGLRDVDRVAPAGGSDDSLP